MNDIYEKYADLLVNYSLYLQKGERLLIRSTYLAEPLIKQVYIKALQAGAYPTVALNLDNEYEHFKYASDEQLKHISKFEEVAITDFDATLKILAPFNVKSLQNIPAEKKALAAQARVNLQKEFMQRAASSQLKWSLCEFPTSSSAQECGKSLNEYTDFIFKACLLEEKDPVKAWQQVSQNQQKLVDYLNNCSELHYQGKDTDLSFSTKNRIWINSDGKHNMPSGEVFTTPVENSINGHIRFSFPGIYLGEEIDDIQLEVKDGLVVKGTASKGNELLQQILKIPGANRFGEAAIGTNQGIQTFSRNMLFDEKMGGTVHLALGACYPETGGQNTSAIHWDLLADLREDGKIFADGQKIFENGKILI